MRKIAEEFQLESIDYPHDCQRIRQVLLENGYVASLQECEIMWRTYSQSMAAEWMGLPDDDDRLYEILETRCSEYFPE